MIDLLSAVRRADLVVVTQRHAEYGPEVLREASLLYCGAGQRAGS